MLIIPHMASNGPTLSELRALAVALPPSERVMAGEVADVVSAIAAVAAHGPDIIREAEGGIGAVLDFLHGRAVDHAKETGADEPQRGQVTPPAASPTAPTSSAPAIDYDKLAAAIVRAERGQTPQTPPAREDTADAPVSSASDPVASAATPDTADTDAHPTGAVTEPTIDTSGNSPDDIIG